MTHALDMSRRQRIAILWWSRLAASLALAFVNFVIQWQASLLLHAPAALATVNVVAQATTAPICLGRPIS